MNNEFKLYNKVINYNRYIRKYVVNNIPNIHRDLRIHMLDENYNMIKCLYKSEYSKGNIRIKNITDMYITICILDFITSELMEIDCKNKKHLIKSVELLTEIKNMTYAWKKSIDDKEKNK